MEYEGKPLEFIQNEALEGSELSRRGNDTIAVVFPAPLQPGATFRCASRYAGSVLSDAGGGLLYVGARGTWYPNRGIAMANYDLTFRFPQPWSLIATGKRVSLEREGGDFVGHWISEQPIPIAGFNLGEYVRSTAKSDDIVVDAYAARGTESSARAQTPPITSPQLFSPHAPGTVEPVPLPPPLQNPAGIGQSLADRAADTLNALSQMLGPYAFSTLSLTENPSAESQGWPGLIFLSSYAYLQPEQLQAMNLSPADAIIYSEVMMPHELAHQWYGDRVSWASYHEQWLLEALANYCSLLLLERSHPADVQLTLENYRQILASKSKEGRRIVEAGPVTLGSAPVVLALPEWLRGHYLWPRDLADSHAALDAARRLAHAGESRWRRHRVSRAAAQPGRSLPGKGDHQHRFRAGRRRGLAAVAVVRESQVAGLVFRRLGEWHSLPATRTLRREVFARTAKGLTASGVIHQNSAPFDLVTSIPVYGVAGERQIYLGRVFAEGAETRFTLPAPADVKQLVLDPYHTVLTEP